MIQLQNICIGYSDRLVIDTLSLAIPTGSFTGIIGRNGSGKTTLLKSILGLLSIRSGTIDVNGTPLSELNATQRSHLMAWVAPDLHTLFRYTVYDLVAMGRTPYLGTWGILQNSDREIIEKTLHKTQLTSLKDRLYETLSSGERQRVNLARALAQDTPFLFLDEPYGHLDLACQNQFTALLKKLSDKTIVMVSHHIEPMRELCDQVGVIEQGRLVQLGNPGMVLTGENLERLFMPI